MKKFLLLIICTSAFWNAKAQFNQNFDASTTMPVGWTTINGGDVGTTTTGQFRVFATTTTAPQYHSPLNAVEITYTSTAHDDYLVTPAITVTAGVSDRLTYWVKNQDAGYVEEYDVKLSSSTATAAAFTTTLTASAGAPSTWTKFTINLTPYIGQTVYVGFHATSADMFRLIFDDIVNDGLPTCSEPTAVVASSITTSSATVSWTAPVPSPAMGFEYYYSTSATAPVAATSPSGSTASGVTTFNLTALTPSINYYVWVRSVCTAVDKSAWSNVLTFNTTLLPGCATMVSPADGDFDIAVNLSNNTTTPTTRQTSINLSWTAPTTGGAVTGYNIYWGANATSLVKLNTTPFVGTSVSITNVAYNTDYAWKIVPVNAGGEAVGCNPFIFTSIAAPDFCLHGVLWPTASYTPATCDAVTINNVTTAGFAGQYSNVLVTAGQTYRFQSSISTDKITLSTNGGLNSVAYGVTPLTWTAVTSGTVRFYTHKANCVNESVNRTRSVICGAALDTASFDISAINVSPNPVKDILSVKLINNIDSISIYNLLGQEVMSNKVSATEAKIDMSNLSSGTYMVKITSNNEVKTTKVIKE